MAKVTMTGWPQGFQMTPPETLPLCPTCGLPKDHEHIPGLVELFQITNQGGDTMLGGALYEQILMAEQLTAEDWKAGGRTIEEQGLIMTKMARKFFDTLKHIQMNDEGNSGALAAGALRNRIQVPGFPK